MIGELGLHAAAKAEKEIWDQTPDYFESYDDLAAAKPWVEKTLNSIIDAGVPLTYWWCYQSDRPTDQRHRQRFDIDRHRNPELLACFVDANQRLKAKLDVPVLNRRTGNVLRKPKDSSANLRVDGKPVVYLYQVPFAPKLTPETFDQSPRLTATGRYQNHPPRPTLQIVQRQ
jgi:hypothetical protein